MTPANLVWTARNLATGALALLACGCAAHDFSALSTFAPPSGGPEYKDPLSIQEIEELQPQLELPIRLAVSQPSAGGGWTHEEIDIIESWEGPLREAGIVRDLVILPESFDAPRCGWRQSYFCGVRAHRATAARFHADALLLISIDTERRGYSSPLSIFNLTGVGLWLVPAHHRDARTVLEGVLVDNRNEYLYAFARSFGVAKQVRPRMYAKWERSVRKARLEALSELGEKMIRQVRQALSPSHAGVRESLRTSSP